MNNLDTLFIKNLPIIGKTLTDAENLIKEHGLYIRVVEIDKDGLMVRGDFQENRVNVGINSGNQVVYINHGCY